MVRSAGSGWTAASPGGHRAGVPIAATPDSPLRRRVALLLGGIALVSIGVALTIRAELGVAPYDVLTTGISDRTGIPIGAAAFALPAAFVGLGLLLGRRPGPGTLVATVLVGPLIGAILAVLPEVTGLAARVPLFAVGCALVACGITAVVVAETGPGPAELVMLAIHDRGLPLASVRTAIEVACVAAGAILGGQLGVGTALFAVGIGPALRHLLDAAGYRPAAVEGAAVAA